MHVASFFLYLPMNLALLIDRIDAVLPQTQCTKCGFDGCRPYASALAAGETAINRCPPGGDAGIEKLAAVLDTPVLPLDESCGLPGPLQLAVIDEAHCIGCTLCIQAFLWMPYWEPISSCIRSYLTCVPAVTYALRPVR